MHCANKNEELKKNVNKKFGKNSTQMKNTQLIQANKMGKLIKDGEHVFLCMIRLWETHGIIEAAKRE